MVYIYIYNETFPHKSESIPVAPNNDWVGLCGLCATEENGKDVGFSPDHHTKHGVSQHSLPEL